MESPSILLEGEIVMLKSMADVERFLKREPIACVATVNSKGKPHVVPVWFTYDNA